MGSKSPSTVTTTTSPPASVLSNYNDVTAQAKQVASTPYQPFSGELVAGLNQGQANAIGELQSGYGTANPYLNTGSSYLDTASAGLGAIQPYLQQASQLGNVGGYVNGATGYLANAAQSYGNAAGLATPQQFSQQALQQFYSPYQQDVVNATQANLNANNQIQAQGLTSNAIGSGSFGGDRAGIAQADLARQQNLANGQTIAGLQNQGYATALGQFNQNQANQYQAAGLQGTIGQGQAGLASTEGSLGNLALSSAGLYSGLGSLQGQTAQSYGALAAQAGNLGQIAQNTSTAGASAALQGSTLQQQNQQQQDQAAYQQYLGALQYPFQTTSYLANIDEGIGQQSGGSSSSPGPSGLSQIASAGTAGLGILGVTGAFGANGYLTGANGLLGSDRRLKEDIEPIGKTFDGQTMYRFRYKGDSTVHTGLMAQEVEKRTPKAVSAGLGGLKMVEYGAATDKAAERGHFAYGGGVAGLGMRPGTLPQQYRPMSDPVPVYDPRNDPDSSFITGGPGAVTMSAAAEKIHDPDARIRQAMRIAAYARGGAVGRPTYDDGGVVDDGSGTGVALPSMSFSAPANWGAGGLTSGAINPTGGVQAGLGGGRGSVQGPGGVRPASMPVLSAALTAASSSPAAGLLGASSAGVGDGSGGGLGGASSNNQNAPDPLGAGSNLWMSILAGGLGAMAGTSPFAMVNLGQGGLAGLREYQDLKQADRQNAVAQADIAYKAGTLGLDRDNLNLKLQQNLMALNANRAAVGLPPIGAYPGAGASSGAAAAPSPGLSGSAGVGIGTASAMAPAASPGLAGAASAASAPITFSPPDPASGASASASGAPLMLMPPSSGSGTAPTNTGTAFWSGVDPNNNPYMLNARANAAQSLGDTTGADALRVRASSILDKGTVLMQDGSVGTIPGYLNNVGAQKAAEAQGAEAGKVQTVYDPDGNPVLVPGSTYQQIAKNGGGQINGVPVSGGQSPYMKATVTNNEEFNKNAIAFEKDYQQNVYALGSLAHIYQSYQGGRGAEAVADLDSFAKQAGIEGMLPDNWQGAAGGFDAAYKTAVDQSFKQLGESGATKAPATGLREALLTTPRPDADPAARYKVITDKLAALSYSHDMYGSFLNGGDPNVGRAIVNFQKTAKYGDYLDAARQGTPLPAGETPASVGRVLGPTGSVGGGSGVGPAGGPPGAPAGGASAPAGAAPAARPAAIPSLPPSVPPGSAYSPSRNMWRAPNGSIYDAQGRPVQ